MERREVVRVAPCVRAGQGSGCEEFVRLSTAPPSARFAGRWLAASSDIWSNSAQAYRRIDVRLIVAFINSQVHRATTHVKRGEHVVDHIRGRDICSNKRGDGHGASWGLTQFSRDRSGLPDAGVQRCGARRVSITHFRHLLWLQEAPCALRDEGTKRSGKRRQSSLPRRT